MARPKNDGSRQFLLSRSGLVLIVFLAVAGYLLWAEHQVHILGNLPLILILGLCIGLHFFMHGGHGGGHGSDEDGPRKGDR